MTASALEDAPTPMMAQYLEIKAANAGYLLFYRMGDFFELFFEDAEIASAALAIALTKRGKHKGAEIPMCGVPVHSAESYLSKLIKAGYKVAICEQVEDPAEAKKRGYKAVVRREVVRLVTAGTLTEDHLLVSHRHNYLGCLTALRHEKEIALAWVDISTGDFYVHRFERARLGAELSRIDPSEVIVSDTLAFESEISEVLKQQTCLVSPLPDIRFDKTNAEKRVKEHFKVGALEGIADFSRGEVTACGVLLDYVLMTQVGQLPTLRFPEKVRGNGFVVIDQATRANLELITTLSRERSGSLLSVIDETVTSSGARLLCDWLSAPLMDVQAINARSSAVAFCVSGGELREKIRSFLKKTPDLGRALSRLTLDRGGPRDLAIVKVALESAFDLGDLLSEWAFKASQVGFEVFPTALESVRVALCHKLASLFEILEAALSEELPQHARDGHFIRSGFLQELDTCCLLRDESRQVIASLEAEYSVYSEIKSLKIKHNNVLGYFIEVTQTHAERMLKAPLSETFHHRQTTANVVRFSTPTLLELEQKITQAAERALALELEIFTRLVGDVKDHATVLLEIARAFSEIDVFSSLAHLAVENQWVKPEIDESLTFVIEGGRHPVVERALKEQAATPFVPNDCVLSAEETGGCLWLVTGPNMAGKSTFLRQNALIVILAQMGSFVPAQKAHIGICDRVFSRVGAADDLARGRSTFMVEMVETALILNHATPRSLVILDEIGRGTATFDGLSIAWACVEYLHDHNRSRALFATHFHELTALEKQLSRLKTVTVHVKEWQGEVIFLHKVGPGVADRSYGIQVAKLAGLPHSVLARATHVMQALEAQDLSAKKRGERMAELPFFSQQTFLENLAPQPIVVERPLWEKEILGSLEALNPDDLTGKMALDFLYDLKERFPR